MLKKILIWTAIPMIVCGIAWFVWYFSGKTQVSEIVISGHHLLRKSEILDLIQPDKNQVLSIEAGQTGSIVELLMVNPRIEKAEVELEFPSTLRVKVWEKEIFLVLKWKQSYYEISNDFKIIAENDIRDDSAIILNVPYAVSVGGIGPSYRQTLTGLGMRLREMRELFPAVFSWLSEFVLMNNGRLKAYLVGRPMVVEFGVGIDVEKMRKIQSSLSFFRVKGLHPHKLDVSGADAVFL